MDVSHLDCTSVADFLQTFKSFFVLKGNKRKLQLMLNKQLAGELCNLDNASTYLFLHHRTFSAFTEMVGERNKRTIYGE